MLAPFRESQRDDPALIELVFVRGGGDEPSELVGALDQVGYVQLSDRETAKEQGMPASSTFPRGESRAAAGAS